MHTRRDQLPPNPSIPSGSGAHAIGATTPDKLLELMTEAVIVADAQARIYFSNASAQRIFGYSASELRGSSLEKLLPSSADNDGISFEVGTPEQAAMRTGSHELTRGRRKSGEEFWVEVSISATLPGQAGLVLVMRELNAQHQTARTVQTHLEGATVGIVQLNERGEVTYINDAWRSFIDENSAYESTCVGLGANYLVACDKSHHSWAHSVADGIRALIAGERDFFELLYDCHSPTQLRWMHLQARRPPGHDRGVVLTHIDHTAQQLTHARSRIQTCVTNSFASHTSLLASCRELAQIICNELEWDFMAIWMPDASTWELRCADVWTRPSLQLQQLEAIKRQMTLAPNQGLPGRVWSSRKAEWIAVEPASPDSPLPMPLREAGFCSGFAFAVKYDDDVLAVIEVSGRMCQWPDYSLLSWLEVAGVQLATAELRERAEHRANAAQDEADAARGQLEAVLACVPALVIAVDRDREVQFVNRSQTGPDWKPFLPGIAHEAIERALDQVLAGGPSQSHDIKVTNPEGGKTWYTLYVAPIANGPQVSGALLVSQDVSQIKRAQEELFDAQRMAALGTMAAGIAHEINTPIQFLGDSIDFLNEANRDVAALLVSLLKLRNSVEHKAPAEETLALAQDTHALEERADLGYLVDNVPKAFDRCVDGLARVTTIVRSMKEFSHPAHKEMSPVDLNRAISATLTVARNEYKYVADVVTDFAELPNVNCHINEINQVVLNIVVNAAHAIGDRIAGGDQRGTITVRTYTQADSAVIAITDTGAGIPEKVRDHIFDPFFTTKEVGKGTGLGLALAWRTIKEKHGGDLTFDTQLGVGTTFYIRLPVAGRTGGGADI